MSSYTFQSHTYPSPLSVYPSPSDLPPLPTDRNPDGKSLVNPPAAAGLSSAYSQFEAPLDNGARGGFDVHIYFYHTNPEHTRYARELWERIRREFPELRIYTFWEKPVGPHPVGMFEVNIFTPHQFGAFVAWLAIWRGPLSVFIHPNTNEPEVSLGQQEFRNHTQRAIWMGERFPLDTTIFQKIDAEKVTEIPRGG
ncbi:DOPA-like domain-containing protein [Cercophora newfieldiana]|uniref:DOPA-like domain-containing protein n=1 Tax=Cercophora newfieldiana TaxID=92897 RepID=A0AA39XVX1_9PEZI|nr:DOPA-like domain-containing protein [Cercophora newfieldiana]